MKARNPQFGGEGGMLPRARFVAVEPKLLSVLLAASRLLTGPAPLAFESLPLLAMMNRAEALSASLRIIAEGVG